MCRHGAPFRRTSSAIRCGVMSSRRFPRCTGPDGLIPDAQVGTSPGCRRSPSSRTWAAVRATQSSAAATGSGLLRRSFAGISVQARDAGASRSNAERLRRGLYTTELGILRMEDPLFRFQQRLGARPVATLAVCGAVAFMGAPAGSTALAAASSLPAPVPAVSDYQLMTASTTPPTEADCYAIGRRCFTAAAMEASYNLPSLYAAGDKGQGMTIAVIDSFGNPNMASDLANFNTQMSLPHMCGEPGASCGAGVPTFQHVYWNGKTEVKAPPAGSNGTGQQDKNAWALETSLDVEWAHAMAPEANILNVTTNPAETLGV